MFPLKCILPINSNPSVRTCIHHAYPTAIIESELLVRLSSNDSLTMWEEWNDNTNTSFSEGGVEIFQNNHGEASAALWRDLRKEEDIIVHVDYFKKRDFVRNVDIFLSGDEVLDEISLEDKTMGVRWNSYGYFNQKDMYFHDTEKFVFIRLMARSGLISCFGSADGKKWEELFSKEYDEAKYSKIGLHVYCGDDRYYEWKYMNYIQLIYNSSNEYKGISLDYYFFPRKNVDNSYMYYINYLDTVYSKISETEDIFESIHQMIHWNIYHSYYVNICMDEFYVPQRAKYKRGHYNHYNLIYGYDDEAERYYVMGYGPNGSPIISELPYSAFLENLISDDKIVKYKYATNEVIHYEFSIEKLIQQLKELYCNIDSSISAMNILKEEPVLYGISIIEYLITNPDGRRDFRHDKRVVFCLMEHGQIMIERLDFLAKKGYLEEKNKIELIGKMKGIIQKLNTLMMLVLKNMIKEVANDRINLLLQEVYDSEKEFGAELLNCLEKEVKRINESSN